MAENGGNGYGRLQRVGEANGGDEVGEEGGFEGGGVEEGGEDSHCSSSISKEKTIGVKRKHDGFKRGQLRVFTLYTLLDAGCASLTTLLDPAKSRSGPSRGCKLRFWTPYEYESSYLPWSLQLYKTQTSTKRTPSSCFRYQQFSLRTRSNNFMTTQKDKFSYNLHCNLFFKAPASQALQ